MSETATANPPSWAPWRSLLTWSPFQIDALGLITLLGAEEVNASVGRLVRSTWVEYFPLLGAYVIANESFREKQAGYNLFNISKGIHTTDFASWFSRWIRAQDFEQTRSFVRWTFEKRRDERLDQVVGVSLCVGGVGFLMALTVLSYDWYGFANALSMLASVLVRTYMVRSLRQAIDDKVLKSVPKEVLSNPESSDEPPQPDRGWLGDPSKILIITADAKVITMLVPKQFMKPPSPFIAQLNPRHRFWYAVMRWLGWVAFAVQVISLGMAQLATQLITVFLMVVPTVLHISKLGCDDSHWSVHIKHSWERVRALFGKPKVVKSSDVEQVTSETKGKPNADAKFEFKYACWVGKYLKAEVYEWPPNHNYKVIKDETDKTSAVCEPYEDGDPRSEKRQLLYAWLQLTEEEIDSMDKWDLFPHKRNGEDDGWLADYEAGVKYIEDLNRQGHGITAIMNRATAKTTDADAPKSPETRGSTRPSTANTNVQTNGAPAPIRPPTRDSSRVQPVNQSPVAATLTSPEGVTTSPESMQMGETTATADMAAQEPPSPGIIRHGTWNSVNSANYVSETAQATRARRQSHGDLAFPARPAHPGRTTSQAP